MKTAMVRCETFEAHAKENERLVRAMFDELRTRALEGLRHTGYWLADGVMFVHLATEVSPDSNPLTTLPAFKAFQAQLKDRRVEATVGTELSASEAYGIAA
ncbi:MAG TPA: hypothetical protein VJN18_03205 [Polyangiaceae bacterium]|nr:hypothetical protein [Polyangiaceae bacterium]